MPNEIDLDTVETRTDDNFGNLLLSSGGLSSPVSEADVMSHGNLPPHPGVAASVPTVPTLPPHPGVAAPMPSVPALPPTLGMPKPRDSEPEFDVSDFLTQDGKKPNTDKIKAASDEEIDLAALKLDSIVAEPDFAARNASPLESGEIPTLNLKVAPLSQKAKDGEMPDLSVLDGDNLQLDFAKKRAQTPQVQQPNAQIPQKAYRPQESDGLMSFGVGDFARQYAKQIVLLVIILCVGAYFGYSRYHHYKITQKHNEPMVEYNYDYSYIENFGALPMQGNPNAVATLAVFCDFQCPYCPNIGGEIEEILERYDGDVRVVWVNFPLPFHPGGYLGALMALMAYDQGKYWEMKDELFAHQDRLMDQDYYKEAAERVGVDIEDYDKNLKDLPAMKIFADDLVAGIEAGHSLGVGGTPAMVINRYVLPPSDKRIAREIMDVEVERSRKVAEETGLEGEALFREVLRTAPQKIENDRFEIDFGPMWNSK